MYVCMYVLVISGVINVIRELNKIGKTQACSEQLSAEKTSRFIMLQVAPFCFFFSLGPFQTALLYRS